MGDLLSCLAWSFSLALAWGHGWMVGLLWPEVATVLCMLRDGKKDVSDG